MSNCSAQAINANGWIVGGAAGMGGAQSSQAMLWQPVPEPSSIIALLCGIGGMSGMIWKRKSA